MHVIPLSAFDLGLAAFLVLLLAALSIPMRLALSKTLLIAASRAIVQLLLLGLVLKTVFILNDPVWIALIALVMLSVAGYEVMARQQRKFLGLWAYGIGTSAMIVSAFSVTLLALTVIINIEPWYAPRYLIPLLGMLLGNTMNGISLTLDRLTEDAYRQRDSIEARLMLGHTSGQAIEHIRRNALRAGLMPLINAMATAGIVSLPGMMTGQLLGGSPPLEAAKYQILIFLLIAAGSGFGAMGAVWLAEKRLFDERGRLRLDRLHAP